MHEGAGSFGKNPSRAGGPPLPVVTSALPLQADGFVAQAGEGRPRAPPMSGLAAQKHYLSRKTFGTLRSTIEICQRLVGFLGFHTIGVGRVLNASKERLWNPEDHRVFVPKGLGWGWSINLYELLRRLKLVVPGR